MSAKKAVCAGAKYRAVIFFSQGSANFFQRRAILQHLPADMTGEELQNIDIVLFFI